MEGLIKFYTILSPDHENHLDQYCTGMIFGLEGSKVLVKMANNLINPVKDGKVQKASVPDVGGLFDSLGSWFGGFGAGVVETAKNTVGDRMGSLKGQLDEL